MTVNHSKLQIPWGWSVGNIGHHAALKMSCNHVCKMPNLREASDNIGLPLFF